ncbi:MAG: hypothetical protein M1396_01050 [Chloroflexi bacterium]|nr:hypothetical protein [Chloroflexota bacterium]
MSKLEIEEAPPPLRLAGSLRARMTSPIFIDTNIPLYVLGRPHPLREPCSEVLRLAAR